MKVCSTLIDERHKLSWELTIENVSIKHLYDNFDNKKPIP